MSTRTILLLGVLLSITGLTNNQSVAADSKYHGLVCDNSRDTKQEIIATKLSNGKVSLTTQSPGSLKGKMLLTVPFSEAEALFSGNIKTLDKKVFKNDQGLSIAFRVDGEQFDGKPTLGILIRTSEGDERLSSCKPKLVLGMHL